VVRQLHFSGAAVTETLLASWDMIIADKCKAKKKTTTTVTTTTKGAVPT